MLKKILILALTLNTPYILSSHPSSRSLEFDLGMSCSALGLGIICGWLAHKQFKKVNQASKDVQHQISVLINMGVKVYKQFKREWVLGFIPTSVFQERYTVMDIPSNFSQQQQEKARASWSLLLASQKKDDNYFMALTAGLGSLILIPVGVAGIIEVIQSFQ